MGVLDWVEDRYEDGKEAADGVTDWFGDRADDGREAADDAADAVIPDWASELGNAEILGYELLENPGGYVVAAVIDWFVGGILSFANAIALMLWQTWLILAGAFVTAGTALLEPFRAIGDVFVSTTAEGDPAGLINIINAQILEVAATAGPASPIVAALLWAVVMFIVAVVIRAVLEVVPLVIPWL